MDYTSLIGPAVVAAGVSGIISVIGLIVSTRTARAMHAEKLASDRDLAERKFAFDEKLAERKFEFDKQLSAHKLDADINLAEKKFRLDAALADRKRRQQLAEEVLSGFYQVRDAVHAIRAPMSFQDEANARPQVEYESAEVARLKNTYYAPLARLDARRAEIGDFLAKRYRTAALFGAAAEEPFQDVHEALTKIVVAAEMLMNGVSHGTQQADPALWRELQGDIWSRVVNPDPIDAKIAAAIAKIEGICRPALEGQGA
jgi:hypothetical protein